MKTIEIFPPGNRLLFACKNGRVCALHNPAYLTTWISNLTTSHFGMPFFKGHLDSKLYLDDLPAQLSTGGMRLPCVSPSDLNRVEYTFGEEGFSL